MKSFGPKPVGRKVNARLTIYAIYTVLSKPQNEDVKFSKHKNEDL